MAPLRHDDASFGTLLKGFRTRRRLTQQHLAEVVGVHRSAVNRWEQGSFLPKQKGLVLELARCLTLDDQETRQLLEASLTALSPYWSVPLPHNPFFTGREEILEVLHTHLYADQVVALTQSYALHGLGGIGKTQIALEYAYRHALEYSAVLWIEAETGETAISSLLRIAELLQLPERQDTDQQRVVAAVQRWLSGHSGWLLIWDNLEEMELLHHFLSSIRQGANLITTRCQALGTLARGMDLAPMEQEEGMLLVLRRAKVLGPEATGEHMQQFAARLPSEYAATRELVTIMGGLPLALDQAGAYIEETGCGLAGYLQRYEQQHARLLERRGGSGNDHPQSVSATFSLLMEQVEQAQRAAADMLRVCALLHAEAIPEELFVEGATHLGPAFEALAADLSQLDQALAVLRSLSLVQRHPESHTLSLHRLVQAVLRDQMSQQEQSLLRRRLIAVLNTLFPEDTSETRRWGQCERLLAHVLLVAAAIPDHAGNQALAEVLRKAADYLHERAQYKQAEQLYQRAVCVGEQQLGAEHPDLAPALSGLAFLYTEQGKYEQAELLGSRALRLSEQALGPEHSRVAYSLNILAILATEQGEYERAEPLFQRAIHIWEQALGSEHSQVANPLYRLGLLYWRQGKYQQAEPLLQHSIHVLEQAFGPASFQVVPPLSTLALLYWKQGTYKRAEPLFQRALSILEQMFESEHPQMAYTLTGLAILYAEQGKYKQAESLFQRTLHIWEQTWGPEHHRVAVSLLNLGEVSAAQGKDEQAEQLYQRALRIEEQAYGPGHPQVAYPLNNLADLYAKQGKYEQAEPLFQRALAIWEQGLGSEHPEVATALNGLANLSFKQRKYEQAAVFFQRALSIQEQYLGQHHPTTAQTLHDLALLWQQQGKLGEALSLAERALQIRTQALGEAHPKTVASRTLFAQLGEARGDIPEGAPLTRCAEELPDQASKEHIWEEAFITPQKTIECSPTENDPLQEFLTACCELHPRAWCRSTELWEAYACWAEKCRERYPLSRGAFIAQLKGHGCCADRTKKARIWRGIALVNKNGDGG